jgi:hypothetical protein
MKLIRYSLAALLSAALTSCGGGVLPTTASGTVTRTQAQGLTTRLNQLVTNISATNIQNPGAAVNGAGVSMASVGPFAEDADIFSNCSTITPNPTKDIDGDGLADEKNYVFDCTNISEGAYLVNKQGTVKILDLDTTKTLADGGGYSFTYDLKYNSQGAYSNEWSGFFKFEQVGTSSVYTSKFASFFTETHSGQDIEGSTVSNFTHTFTPTDAAQFWTAGTAKTTGFYRVIVKGDNGEGEILDWDFTFKFDADLVYEAEAVAGCKFFYKSGYLQFTDASSNVIRYDYSCDKYTYSFNGNVISTQN